MRKRVFGRKFGRDTDGRKELFRNLMRAFILHGKLKTTESKAAAIRSEIEKMVTKAKKKGDQAYRDIIKRLPQEEVAQRLIADIAPKFADRPGGYTRVLKLGNRVKDAAPMVLLLWVEMVEPFVPKSEKREKTATKSKEAEVKVEKNKKEDKKAKKETKKK